MENEEQNRAPLQEYHELIERIGDAMDDLGISQIQYGKTKIIRED